ncbi:hypothetical protein [Micromonospora echinofusca]|uniref:Adhesin n=1 Tax=Micromonospora echinofusca TaxID=47858 RepID=A0ABS3VWX4_MICEH|nr:hypothetical protein [Micromonospora echinofusca]MBO4209037.1 hypothetical protein [Micromonospora echinofusca]
MSDSESARTGADRSDFDDHYDEDWTDDDPDRRRPGLWTRLARTGLRRPSVPLLAALCVGILAVLIGIVLTGADGKEPPGQVPAAQSTDGPPIEFAPVGDGDDPEQSPAPTPDATSPSPGSGQPSPSPEVSGGSPSSPSRAPRPTPGNPTGGTPSPAAPLKPAVTFTEVGGYHCPDTATRGFRHSGWYSDGKRGWYSIGTGGWTANGCPGHYEAMPMSGSATKDDSGLYAEWWFAVGSATRSCAASTYVPTTTDDRNVAGRPATYQVRDVEGGPVRATFTIDQRANRGRWVSAGTYPVTGGRIVIRSVNRGIDWNASGETLEHIAVAQMRVTCY